MTKIYILWYIYLIYELKSKYHLFNLFITVIVLDRNLMKNIKIILRTILIGSFGGIAFNLLLLPLPWVLGPAFFIAIFALFGNEVLIPQQLRNPFIGIIGIWLGQSFSSSVFLELNEWIISIALLFLYVPFSYLITYLFLHKIRKIGKAESFFISSPGGLLEMVLGAEECGANSKLVGLVHMMRIFLTVFTIPTLILILFPGSFEREATWPNFTGSIIDCLIILLILPVGLIFGKFFKIPGRRLFGPLIISAILHVTEIVDLNAPVIIFIVAQLITGSFFGSNMNGLNWKIARNYIGHAIGIVFSLSICMIPFIFVISYLINSRPEAIILAYSPGGINEMGLVAATLGIKPAFVITHHLFRLFIVVLILGFAQKFIYPKLKLILKNSN